MEEEKKSDVVPFAATNFRLQKRVFGIKSDDRRRHVYVIGKTGMGKSTLLENLVYSDIQRGHGICYVDPHGDTAEKILQWIPQNRIKDTIFFNPSDLNYPIAFNVLEKVAPEFRNLVASGLVSVYKKLWADSWGPRLEYILRYCILALLDSPDSTLLGINRMLVDKRFRDAILSRVTDPVVRAFWEDEFTKWNDRVLAEVISPIQNKVGQFLSNSMIRNIVGQLESSMNMREIMDESKILILDLSKGRMGEDASALLGAMMITKMQLAAMSRVDTPEHERKDFYLYVDEFQNFATDSFANILSEARKYRLCLTIAHQYIAQLQHGDSTVVRDAVFGNVGTLVVFRVGAKDAEFLELEFAPQFTMEELVNLPKWKMYMRLMVDGVASDPFSADALPPLGTTNFGHEKEVIDYTRKTYSKSKAEVEDVIREWAAGSGVKLQTFGDAEKKTDFHTGVTPLDAYEKEKAARAVESRPFEEKREEKPIVWNGNCDACGKDLALTFEPDMSRPVLCQDDLKSFRKGGLPGGVVEAMMGKVYERKNKRIAAAAPAPVRADRPRSASPAPRRDDRPRPSSSAPRRDDRPRFDKPRDTRPSLTPSKPITPSAPQQKGTIRIVSSMEVEKVEPPKPAIDPKIVLEKMEEKTVDFAGHKVHDEEHKHDSAEKEASKQHQSDDDVKAQDPTNFRVTNKEDSKLEHDDDRLDRSER